MELRIGAGFSIVPHVWVGYTVPLGHARRCLAHNGHGSPLGGLVGLIVIYALIRGALGAG